ncbi:uncharacterized protein LOC126912632 [Spodoptera frugiperda]|uniref:Uncharacterized protein LOC126912632 n=1 Tax=Spodoptera frugiperda TaxID=7108 RepID=A0A9R0F5U6_SPOFR|nr:uncharacterized protein LOC126912632 [Spodoptera frugiperda]
MIVIIHFTRVIIFESVWYRVRNLKKRLEYMLSQVLVTVLTFIPGLVASIHDIISEYPKPIIRISMQQIITELIIMCVPAIFSEIINREIYSMKFLLSKHMLVCKNDDMRELMEDCLTFLEHRPFKYTVFRLFSIDINMVFTMINLCITYAIAIIQFGHYFN